LKARAIIIAVEYNKDKPVYPALKSIFDMYVFRDSATGTHCTQSILQTVAQDKRIINTPLLIMLGIQRDGTDLTKAVREVCDIVSGILLTKTQARRNGNSVPKLVWFVQPFDLATIIVPSDKFKQNHGLLSGINWLTRVLTNS
jgi:hypothetical protein